MFNFVVCWSCS